MQKIIIIVSALLIFSCSAQNPNTENPSVQWMQYKNLEDAGFDPVKLSHVKQTFIEQGGDVLFIVRDGKVVLSIGQISRCFRQTSVRKSYLNALFGIYSANGTIDLNKTLAELKIDDIDDLTPSEKEATVLNLLESRSGIYHSSAYSPESMEKKLPERGRYKPGEHWFYNNWDFNTLGAIFNIITKKDLFEEFEEKIATPLKFEDFSIEKTKYLYESDTSRYPAYLFRMSARDMAKFGQLYLNEGTWNDEQIIATDWINESFKVHSPNGKDSSGVYWDDYGLLWWISNQIKDEPVYYASGSGVQRISIFPNSKMVMVHIVDNYQPKQVVEAQVDHLTRLLLEAKVGEPVSNPEVIPLSVENFKINTVNIPQDALLKFEGVYSNPRLGNFSITAKSNTLLLEAAIGNFILYHTGNSTFINKDIQIPMSFVKGQNEDVGIFNILLDDKRKIRKFEFHY